MSKVKTDLKGVYRKIGRFKQGGEVKLAEMVLKDSDPFIPKKSGKLRNSGTVGNKGVEWTEPYADKMYSEPMTNYTTPGTGPRWVDKAKSIHMDKWRKEIER